MNLKKNIIFFYIIHFLEACIFIIPIWSFFFMNQLELSFYIALFITIFPGFISTIFEIPTGAITDRVGRKKTYILGVILIILGRTFFLWTKQIYLLIISSILLGIGYSFTSGNLESLMHDNLIENNQEAKFKNISANAYIYLFIGRGLTCITAGYLYLINPYSPIYLTTLAYILVLISILFIKESNYIKSHSENILAHIKDTIKFIYNNHEIKLFIFYGFILSGIGNIYWFTFQPYLKQIGYEIGTIGIIFGIISFLSALGSHIIKKLQNKLTALQIGKFTFYFLFIIGILFYILKNKFGATPIILISILFGFQMPLANNYLSSQINSARKATLLSIYSFIITIGYFTFGNISGYLIDIISLHTLYLYVVLFYILLIIGERIYTKN